MTRIVRTAYRYQRPPRKRQAAVLEVPAVVKAAWRCVMRTVLTPDGCFLSVISAARHHKVTSGAVRDRIRKGHTGWRDGEPYQIPAGFVPLASSRGHRRKDRAPSPAENEP